MFRLSSCEMFPQGIPSIVITPIAPLQIGWVKLQGQYWRAQLHALIGYMTLLPGQSVLAVGREANRLIVIPRHCILWEQYFSDDFGLFINPAAVREMQRYETFKPFVQLGPNFKCKLTS